MNTSLMRDMLEANRLLESSHVEIDSVDDSTKEVRVRVELVWNYRAIGPDGQVLEDQTKATKVRQGGILVIPLGALYRVSPDGGLPISYNDDVDVE